MSSNYGSEWTWKQFYQAIGWRGVLGILVRCLDRRPIGYNPYYWIGALDIKSSSEPGWFELSWRPIRGSTFHNYVSKSDFHFIPTWRSMPGNGYNYWYKSNHFELKWLWWEFNFWCQWDHICHIGGPVDWPEKVTPRIYGTPFQKMINEG